MLCDEIRKKATTSNSNIRNLLLMRCVEGHVETFDKDWNRTIIPLLLSLQFIPVLLSLQSEQNKNSTKNIEDTLIHLLENCFSLHRSIVIIHSIVHKRTLDRLKALTTQRVYKNSSESLVDDDENKHIDDHAGTMAITIRNEIRQNIKKYSRTLQKISTCMEDIHSEIDNFIDFIYSQCVNNSSLSGHIKIYLQFFLPFSRGYSLTYIEHKQILLDQVTIEYKRAIVNAGLLKDKRTYEIAYDIDRKQKPPLKIRLAELVKTHKSLQLEIIEKTQQAETVKTEELDRLEREIRVLEKQETDVVTEHKKVEDELTAVTKFDYTIQGRI